MSVAPIIDETVKYYFIYRVFHQLVLFRAIFFSTILISLNGVKFIRFDMVDIFDVFNEANIFIIGCVTFETLCAKCI